MPDLARATSQQPRTLSNVLIGIKKNAAREERVNIEGVGCSPGNSPLFKKLSAAAQETLGRNLERGHRENRRVYVRAFENRAHLRAH